MKDILIIHHNDDDGFASAYIAKYYFETREQNVDITLIEADYIYPLEKLIEKTHKLDPYEFDEILLLDYSISTSENIRYIQTLHHDWLNITWIDHHRTSVETMHMYPYLKEFRGIVCDGISATALTYIYFMIGKSLFDKVSPILSSAIISKVPMRPDQRDKIFEIIKIPKVLRAINDYDIWDHRNPETTLFHYGFNISYYVIYSILDESVAATDIEDKIYSKAVEDGTVITDYIDKVNSEDIDAASFAWALNVDGRDYKCICLNTMKTTSLTFGDHIKDYDICIAFWYNGKKIAWSYSLYTVKSNVDCAAIAKSFGGGGHKQAAGFSSKELIFK